MIERRRIYVAVLVIAILSILSTQIYPVVWYSPAISGKILDADTKLPIPGVVVFARWRITHPLAETDKYMAIEEGVTDASGRFRLAAWGPKFRFRPGFILPGEPTIVALRSGYIPLKYDNEQKAWGAFGQYSPAIIRYWLDDETLEMKPVNGDVVSYRDAIFVLSSELTSVADNGCYRTMLPLALRELTSVREWLIQRGQGEMLSGFQISSTPHCSRSEQLIRDFFQ